LRHSTSPFCNEFFWDSVLQTICSGCPWISVSWVARIAGVSHRHLSFFFFFKLKALCLLARLSITWTTPPAFFALVNFQIGSCAFASASLKPWFFYLHFHLHLPNSWDDRDEPRHQCSLLLTLFLITLYGIWLVLEIRPQKPLGVTIEDTEMENCLNKAKFTSAGGCAGTWAQHAHSQPGLQLVLI
jgi:hypothetical protein